MKVFHAAVLSVVALVSVAGAQPTTQPQTVEQIEARIAALERELADLKVQLHRAKAAASTQPDYVPLRNSVEAFLAGLPATWWDRQATELQVQQLQATAKGRLLIIELAIVSAERRRSGIPHFYIALTGSTTASGGGRPIPCTIEAEMPIQTGPVLAERPVGSTVKLRGQIVRWGYQAAAPARPGISAREERFTFWLENCQLLK